MVLAMFRFVSPGDVTSAPVRDALNYPYRCRVDKFQSLRPSPKYILCIYMEDSGPHIKCTSLCKYSGSYTTVCHISERKRSPAKGIRN